MISICKVNNFLQIILSHMKDINKLFLIFALARLV